MALNGYASAQDVADLAAAVQALANAMGVRVGLTENSLDNKLDGGPDVVLQVAGATLKGNSVGLINLKTAGNVSVFGVSSIEAYAGSTGVATKGAGRAYFGSLTPSGDDSALLICRAVEGQGLFSHGLRDESVFKSNLDSAYTSFDATPTYATNTGAKYNHGYAYQWRAMMGAANGMDLMSGFVSNPRISNGRVDRLIHMDIQSATLTSGGTMGQHVGLHIAPMTPGDVFTYAIYIDEDDCYFGGDNQFGGRIFGATQIEADNLHASGAITGYLPSGGVLMAKPGLYAQLLSYADADGAPSPLQINKGGGQVLIGGGNTGPVIGTDFEVVGNAGVTGYMKVNGDLRVAATNASGSIVSFNSSGGVLTCKPGAYGLIRSYANGSGDPQGLHVNPTVGGNPGGQVVINGPYNFTGHELEVNGAAYTSGRVIAAGGLAVGNSAAATTPGAVAKKMEVFDAAGASLGFIPIYSTIT